MPGHARAVGGVNWKKPKRKRQSFSGKINSMATTGRVLIVPIVVMANPNEVTIHIFGLPTKLEFYCMKRITEWLNLIAALIRLADVMFRTGLLDLFSGGSQ